MKRNFLFLGCYTKDIYDFVNYFFKLKKKKLKQKVETIRLGSSHPIPMEMMPIIGFTEHSVTSDCINKQIVKIGQIIKKLLGQNFNIQVKKKNDLLLILVNVWFPEVPFIYMHRQ